VGSVLASGRRHGSQDIDLREGIVDDVLGRGVQVWLDGLKATPTPDLHHDTRVHLFVDEESLREPAPEVVGADLPEVLDAGLVSSTFGRTLHDGADAWLFQIDEGVSRCDILAVLKALEVPLNAVGQEGVAWLPTVPARILPRADSKSVLAALALCDITRCGLWDFEGAEADVRAELDDDVVTLAPRRSPEVLDLPVGEPDFVFVAAGRFNTHYD
jgi:hypothetical protein